MEARELEVLRVGVLGESGVGKAALARRFAGEAARRAVSIAGEAPVLAEVSVGDAAAGLGRAPAALPPEALVLVYVYDITDEASFGAAERGLGRAAAQGATAVALVGNKCDKAAERAVPVRRGMEAAIRHGASFLETSGKDGTNVDDAFCDALHRAATRARRAPPPPDVDGGPAAARISAALQRLGIAAETAVRVVGQLKPKAAEDGLKCVELAMATQWEAAPGGEAQSEAALVESLAACGIREDVARRVVQQVAVPSQVTDGLRLMELAMATQWAQT